MRESWHPFVVPMAASTSAIMGASGLPLHFHRETIHPRWKNTFFLPARFRSLERLLQGAGANYS